MLELIRRNAQLANLNTRVEIHGPDFVPAADLELAIDLTIEDLVLFGPTLRSAWFESGDAPALRTPEVTGPFDVEGELVGCVLTVHYGPSGRGDMKLGGSRVSKYRLDPQEGGAVKFLCKVACHPDPDKEIGKLYRLQKAMVEISIEPAQSELALEPQKQAEPAQPAVH